MVTPSDKLAMIGPSLADLVLEIFCFAASPSFRGVATLVSKARQAVKDAGSSSPELAKAHSDLGKHITDVLTIKVKEARQLRLDLGVDISLLTQAETAVAALISTDAEQDLVVLSAVRDPAGFENYLRTRAAKYRQQIEEQAEPYFDALVRAVAAAYVEIAPWSDSFVVIALKSLLGECTDIKEQLNASQIENRQLFSQILQLLQSLTEAIENLSKPSHTERVNFGSRPDVVAEDRFIERGEQEQLNALISDPTQRRTVLVGMRGCGKTQLASALAQQCEDAHWSLIAWLNAGSPESITSDLVELARELKIDTSDQPAPETIIRRLFTRLKSADPSDRLIVFDNVENIDDLRGLVPSGEGLRAVATTTNNAGWEHHWKIIKVGVFDRSDSINYLLTVTNSINHDAADTLARRLGDLPLALAQAAATALDEDWTLTQYLRLLKKHRSEQVIRSIPGDEYPHDVYGALRMAIRGTLNNLDEGTRRAARRQLGALALLAASGVPTHWLDPMSEEPNDAEFHDHGRAADEDAHIALTKLVRRSIVQQSADKATTMLHRLQAQAYRESWNKEERQVAYDSAVSVLASVDIDRLPSDDSDARFQETRNLIEHLRAFGAQDCFHCLHDYRPVTSALCRAFTHARDLGLLPEALSLAQSVDTLLDLQVVDALDILSLRSHLAYTYLHAGRSADAIKRYERVLRSSKHALGPIDRVTLTIQNDLAYAYYWEGDTGKAIDLFEQVLNDRTRILSSDDEDTLMTGSYLALAYADDGQLERAITLGEQVVKDRDRVLKPDHKHTLVTRNNLADAYKSVGRLTDAIKMYEYVLGARIRTLGNTHHHTRITRNDLAQTYEQAGDLPKAISMYEDLHNDHIRMYGPDHESTIEVRDRLEAAKRELERQEDGSAAE